MYSKPRLRKNFYLPLEYQVFLPPHTMSTAVLPYAFHHMKKSSQFTCISYHRLSHSKSFILKPKKHQSPLKKMNDEIVFIQSVNGSGTEGQGNINTPTNPIQGDVQFLKSISRTSVNNQSAISTLSSSLTRTCNDVEVVFVQNIGKSPRHPLAREDSTPEMKRPRTNDMQSVQSSSTVTGVIRTEKAILDELNQGLMQYPVRQRLNNSSTNTGTIPLQEVTSTAQCSDVEINFSHNLLFDPPTTSQSLSNESKTTKPYNTDETVLKRESSSNEVKIMSYNILAQTLLMRHRNLYGHIERSDLQWYNRLRNIIAEILEYNCDIVCLQEVEEVHLEHLTSRLVDYCYIYKKRTGPTVDGCCVFYKDSKFTLVKEKCVEYFKSESHHVMNKHNIGLIVCLKSADNHIIVGNTHLLYSPRRSDVRYEQCKLLLQQIKCFRETVPRSQTPVVITGDFNSEPNSGLYPYIIRSKDLKLTSAYDPLQSFISTYHDHWCLVDYIFYTAEGLKLVDQKLLPKHGERISRIPNTTEGSDHFSLVAKFTFS